MVGAAQRAPHPAVAHPLLDGGGLVLRQGAVPARDQLLAGRRRGDPVLLHLARAIPRLGGILCRLPVGLAAFLDPERQHDLGIPESVRAGPAPAAHGLLFPAQGQPVEQPRGALVCRFGDVRRHGTGQHGQWGDHAAPADAAGTCTAHESPAGDRPGRPVHSGRLPVLPWLPGRGRAWFADAVAEGDSRRGDRLHAGLSGWPLLFLPGREPSGTHVCPDRQCRAGGGLDSLPAEGAFRATSLQSGAGDALLHPVYRRIGLRNGRRQGHLWRRTGVDQPLHDPCPDGMGCLLRAGCSRAEEHGARHSLVLGHSLCTAGDIHAVLPATCHHAPDRRAL